MRTLRLLVSRSWRQSRSAMHHHSKACGDKFCEQVPLFHGKILSFILRSVVATSRPKMFGTSGSTRRVRNARFCAGKTHVRARMLLPLSPSESLRKSERPDWHAASYSTRQIAKLALP